MHADFLQSQNWENLQRSLGRETLRIEGALFIRRKLPLGLSYLYCPRPRKVPAFESIKKSAQRKDVFAWIDPVFEVKPLFRLALRKPPKQPRGTLVLNLSKSEEELLNSMKQKTRYNIRLAKKKEVAVERINDWKLFWRLTQATVKRDGIRPHGRDHYRKLLELPVVEMFAASYKGEVLAAALSIKDSDTFYYLHGASGNERKNFMAPYLLQWEMIKYARKRGFKYYDFFGVDQRRYPGVSRFKIGFAPKTEIITYPAAVLVGLKTFWFKLYNLLK